MGLGYCVSGIMLSTLQMSPPLILPAALYLCLISVSAEEQRKLRFRRVERLVQQHTANVLTVGTLDKSFTAG